MAKSLIVNCHECGKPMHKSEAKTFEVLEGWEYKPVFVCSTVCLFNALLEKAEAVRNADIALENCR